MKAEFATPPSLLRRSPKCWPKNKVQKNMDKKRHKAEQLLPFTISNVGALYAYGHVKYALGEKGLDGVESWILAGFCLALSAWIINEAAKARRRAGWLASAGILYYCMLRHLAPLLAQAYSYVFGNSSLLYADIGTYAILTGFFAVAGTVCLYRS